MKAVITGGAGFIGFHLARRHASLGDEVVLLDNFFKTAGGADADFQRLLEEPGIRFVQVDMTQPLREAAAALAGADVVYHLAAINGTQLFYDIPYQVARANLLLTLNLLDALERHRPGVLIYSSTSEVYAGAEQLGALRVPTDESVPVVFPQPTPVRFSYGTSKFMGEVLCRQFSRHAGTPCTIVRYHNIYGPRMGTRHVIPEFIERVRKREDPFAIYGGHETRAFCYVEDAVEATWRVATESACRGELLHIGNPLETRIEDLARLVMRRMSHQARLEERGSREGSVARRCPDISRLVRLTGFAPSVPLENGLDRTIAWYTRALEPMATL